MRLLERDSETSTQASSLVAQDEISFHQKIKETDIQAKGGKEDQETENLAEKEVLDAVSNDLSNLTFGETVRKERLEQLARIAAAVDAQKSTVTRSSAGKIISGSSGECGDHRKTRETEVQSVKVKEEERTSEITPKQIDEGEQETEEVINKIICNESEERILESANKGSVDHTDADEVSLELRADSMQDQPDKGQVVVKSNLSTENAGQKVTTPHLTKQKKIKSKNKPKEVAEPAMLPLKLVEITLFEWRTENTVRFLQGGDYKEDNSSAVVEDSGAVSGIPEQAPAKLEAGQSKGRRDDLDSDDDSDEGEFLNGEIFVLHIVIGENEYSKGPLIKSATTKESAPPFIVELCILFCCSLDL